MNVYPVSFVFVLNLGKNIVSSTSLYIRFKDLRKGVYCVLWAFFVFFWILTLVLCGELLLRLLNEERNSSSIDMLNARSCQYRTADDIEFQKVNENVCPPDTVRWRVRERGVFCELDEEGRVALAKERQELILLCDIEGRIMKIYACDAKPEINQLSTRVSVGDSIEKLFSPEEFQDALMAIRQANPREFPLRDYDVLLDSAQKYLMEFNVLYVEGKVPSFALFIGESRYEEFMRRYRPNIFRRNWYMGQFINSVFWTNSLGFRDREISIPKPKDVIRIICIGGSTTVEGPHNELTYPKLLEKRLREHFKTENVEVINCGVDGMAIVGELERMPDWIHLEPDLIIHYNIINRAAFLMQRGLEKALEDHGVPGKIHYYLTESEVVNSFFNLSLYPPCQYYRRELTDDVIARLREMAVMAREAGAKMAIASFAIPRINAITDAERRYYESVFNLQFRHVGKLMELTRFIEEYNQLIKKLCTEENLLYIPVAENFTGGIETFADVCHLRLPGIKKKSEIMFPFLRDYLSEHYPALASPSP